MSGDPAPPQATLRPSYSSNSLAAAEQLEALMRHAVAGNEEHDGGMFMQALAANGGAGEGHMASCGFAAAAGAQKPEHAHYRGAVMQAGMQWNGHQPPEQSYFHALNDQMSFSQNSLPMLLQRGREEHPGYHPGIHPGSMARARMPAHAAASIGQLHSAHPNSLSMLYAGATAMGAHGGLDGRMPHAVSHLAMAHDPRGVEHPNESHQKRRFVWTADLHARFEGACNQLGLDNAKPKSILRLMNVEGLTKANIKSHLQKYRCMMNKRAAAHEGSDTPSPMSARYVGSRMTPQAPASVPVGTGPKMGQPDMCPVPELVKEESSGASVEMEPMSTGSEMPAVSANAIRLTDSTTPLSLQGNLQEQEKTLMEQMQLQEKLSQQLKEQMRLQAEMEGMTQACKGHDNVGLAAKKREILALKDQLQQELQEHLRLQRELLIKLDQVVLPGAESASSKKADGPTQMSSAYGESTSVADESSALENNGDDDDDESAENEEGAGVAAGAPGSPAGAQARAPEAVSAVGAPADKEPTEENPSNDGDAKRQRVE